MLGVPRGVHEEVEPGEGEGVGGLEEALCWEGGAVRWSPAGDEEGKWRLERRTDRLNFAQPNNGTNNLMSFEHIASVERSEKMNLFHEPASYRAEVMIPGAPRRSLGYTMTQQFRASPELFASLKDAQLWCEREVRLMEVGELM